MAMKAAPMNADLLKYMRRKVRLPPSPIEYQVFGINWDTEYLMLIGHHPVHHSTVDLVPEITGEEDGWYKP